jgi:5,10-methylene-tetrahydrofolate dehydrogenase/methenyl tetrahydrofolate cyclohydrolase
MTAKVIDGKAFAATVRAQVAQHVTRLKEENGIQPGLAVVLVGEDPASKVYVKNKHASTVEVGMASFEHRRDASISEAELLALIDQLNADPKVHGILVQLPLPGHLNSELVINRIDPAKDVDGFHISNVGLAGNRAEVDGALHAAGLPDDAAGSPWETGGAECGGRGAVEHRRQADGAASVGRQLHGDDRA